MTKLTVFGAGFFLLLCGGIYAAMRFPIGCLFVPCDRSIEFVLQPPRQALDGCDLLLFAASDKTLSEPLHRLALQTLAAQGDHGAGEAGGPPEGPRRSLP